MKNEVVSWVADEMEEIMIPFLFLTFFFKGMFNFKHRDASSSEFMRVFTFDLHIIALSELAKNCYFLICRSCTYSTRASVHLTMLSTAMKNICNYA